MLESRVGSRGNTSPTGILDSPDRISLSAKYTSYTATEDWTTWLQYHLGKSDDRFRSRNCRLSAQIWGGLLNHMKGMHTVAGFFGRLEHGLVICRSF